MRVGSYCGLVNSHYPLDWVIYVRITEYRIRITNVMLVFSIDCRVKPDNDEVFKIATTLMSYPNLIGVSLYRIRITEKRGLFDDIDCRIKCGNDEVVMFDNNEIAKFGNDEMETI